ncbi:spermidine/putrescine ABC transporter ATP-binding protein [Bacillus sp. UFRGS-B20]|nr:spermidine/putrescine ABC transporter ATP-binding protein [Bacillus sp. UFRGS-B20]
MALHYSFTYIPLLTGNRLSPQNPFRAKKLDGRLTARKLPIGEG